MRLPAPVSEPGEETCEGPVKIIAFDLDGTLVDSVGDIAVGLNCGLADLGLGPIDEELVRTFVGNGAVKLVERALAHHGSDIARAPELLERFRHHYEKDLTARTRPFPGIVEMLPRLRTVARLAVATNKPGAFARPIVEALFPGTFDLVLGPDDVGTLKPDPAILQRIERDLDGRLVAFVGDSAVDVETARRAGVLDVGVLWGLRPDEAGAASRTVSSAGELLDVLSSL